MTNEKGLFAQADLRNVRGSTIERKIMSTKTITKRIALVAASALAIGGFTAVSANATPPVAIYVTNASNTYSSTAGAGTIAITSATSAVVGTGTAFASTDVGRAIYVAGTYEGTIGAVADATHVTLLDTIAADVPALSAYSLGTQTTTGVVNNVFSTTQISGMTVTAGQKVDLVVTSSTNNQTAGSKIRVVATGYGTLGTSLVEHAAGLTNAVNFTAPNTAGTYALSVVYSDGGSDFVTVTGITTATFNLTVTAAPGYTGGASTVYSNDLVADASSTTDGTIYGIKSLNTQAGNLTVTVKNSDGSFCTACLVGGYITGAGYLEEDANNNGAFGDVTGGTKVRSLTALAPKSTNGVASIGVFGDGTQGTGVITITVTDAAGNVTTLGTKNVVFYGAVASLKLVKQPYTVLKAGGALSGIKTGLLSAAATTLLASPAFVVEALDSAGNPVGGLSASLSAVSSDSTQVASASNNEDVVTTIDPNSTWGGPGFYVFDATSASSSTSGGKGTLTIKILNPADTTNTTYLTTTVNFSIGGVVAKEVISTDAASYAPGAVMTVTITATDSKGNPVYDGATSPALTFSKAVGGSYAASVYAAGKQTNSVNTLFAPSVAGPFLITGTGTDVAATAITANATVSSVNDAQIASLITKINALAALIAKIQKKLGVK